MRIPSQISISQDESLEEPAPTPDEGLRIGLFSESFRPVQNGVTTSLLLHGSANPIGGQSVVVKMKWNTSVDDMIVPDAPRMVKFALGENVKQSGGRGGTRFPTTRMGVEAVYRRAFAEAKT